MTIQPPRKSALSAPFCEAFLERSQTSAIDQREREMKVVCVTGASGYIASWLVKLLLQGGYTVKATVRDPSQFKTLDYIRT